MANRPPPLNQPGFDLYATRQPRLVGVYVTLIVITTIFTSLRLCSRRVSDAGFWWDDFLIVLAWLASILVPICGLVTIRISGYGKHIWVASKNPNLSVERFMMALFATEVCWTIATCAVKFSILAFYRRIFPIKQLGKICLILGVVVGSWLVACLITEGLQCRPLSSFWYQSKTADCVDLEKIFVGAGSINAVMDFVIVALPIPLVWRLRTTGPQKSVLTGIFAMAGFVCIVSIIRVVTLTRLIDIDMTWNWVDEGIWTAVEPTMGVVAACLPSLRPLFSTLWRGTHRGPLLDNKSSTFSSTATSGGQAPFHLRDRLGGSSAGGIGVRQWSSSEVPINGAQEDDVWIHNVDVSGGEGGARKGRGKGGVEGGWERMELPERGIRVKTEITLLSTERLEYRDRLF